jgi:hypothetical protein
MIEAIEAAAWADLYAAAPPALAQAVGLEHEIIDGGHVFRARLPSPLFNRVLAMPALTDALLDAVRPGMYLQLPPALCGDERLTAHGLVEKTRWVKLRRAAGDPPVGAGPRVVVADADRAETFARTLCVGYGLPAALVPWHAALVGRPRWRAYLAYDGETPIATAVLFVDGAIAWLGGAATVPAHRGRGGQGALIARRIADAAELGAADLVTETLVPAPDTKNPSLDNLRGSGFTVAYERTNFAA